jgi:inosose dehydratase
MRTSTSRRRFLTLLSAGGAAALLPVHAFAAGDGMRFGYTAMTWGADIRQAIDDIAELGYKGIQFRNDVMEQFKPTELRELLDRKGLTFTAMSSGVVDIGADPQEEVARHVANARYVKECGGEFLQLLDKLSSFGRPVNLADAGKLGRLLTEIGKGTAALGVTTSYHNHLNTLSETPAGLAAVLAASDPRFVKFELDTAHAVGGGADPVQLIETYRDRLSFLHLKDLVDQTGDPKAKYPFQFVELGRGRVDLPAVFAALERSRFQGWAVIELDRVPDKTRTPKQSAAISKAYLAAHGQRV